MLKLARDIRSYVNPKKLYGKAGTAVSIISDKGTVLVVEDTEGNRFPVYPEDVTKDQTKIEYTATAEPPKQENKRWSKSGKKSIQKNLF